MFLPPTFKPQEIATLDKQKLDDTIPCLCGADVPLRDCLCVWTHKAGSEKYGYYAACGIGCITTHVSLGSA